MALLACRHTTPAHAQVVEPLWLQRAVPSQPRNHGQPRPSNHPPDAWLHPYKGPAQRQPRHRQGPRRLQQRNSPVQHLDSRRLGLPHAGQPNPMVRRGRLRPFLARVRHCRMGLQAVRVPQTALQHVRHLHLALLNHSRRGQRLPLRDARPRPRVAARGIAGLCRPKRHPRPRQALRQGSGGQRGPQCHARGQQRHPGTANVPRAPGQAVRANGPARAARQSRRGESRRRRPGYRRSWDCHRHQRGRHGGIVSLRGEESRGTLRGVIHDHVRRHDSRVYNLGTVQKYRPEAGFTVNNELYLDDEAYEAYEKWT